MRDNIPHEENDLIPCNNCNNCKKGDMCINIITNDFDNVNPSHVDYLEQIIVLEDGEDSQEPPLCYVPNNNKFVRIPQCKIAQV